MSESIFKTFLGGWLLPFLSKHGWCLARKFFEGIIEGTFGIETNVICHLKDGIAIFLRVTEQSLGFFDTVFIDEIKEIFVQLFIDYLRELIIRQANQS